MTARRLELLAQHIEFGARSISRRVRAGDHDRARQEASQMRGLLAQLEEELPRYAPHPGDPEARVPSTSPRWTPADTVLDTYQAVRADVEAEDAAEVGLAPEPRTFTVAPVRVPSGFVEVAPNVFEGRGQRVTLGRVDPDDAAHDCDEMGCSSAGDHVVRREVLHG